MRRSVFLTATAAIFLAAEAVHAQTVLRNAHGLSELHPTERPFNAKFDFQAQIVCACTNSSRLMLVRDNTGCAVMANHCRWPECEFSAGDTVHVRGFVYSRPESGIYVAMTNAVFIRAGTPPAPEDVTVSGLLADAMPTKYVRLQGFVREVRHDEIDRGWSHMLLTTNGETVYVFFCHADTEDRQLQDFLDAEVRVTGICRPFSIGRRRFMGSIVVFDDMSAVEVVTPPPADPFDVPILEDISHAQASRISGLGRRKVSGRVLACWHGDRILLASDGGCLLKIETESLPLPACGRRIEASGFPETDLYRINLSRATWRPLPGPAESATAAKDVSPKDILLNNEGRQEVKSTFHGSAIRFRGLVRKLPSPGDEVPVMTVDSDGFLIPVDATSCPESVGRLSVGDSAEISGICVMDTENWHPNGPIPHIRGFLLALRTGEDVLVLARAPFWTPVRLTAVIGVLLLVLVGIVIWNRILNRLVERRGRALMREEIARAEADFRSEERTRLAVELHDTIAQNLTGVSLRLDAVQLAAEGNPNLLPKHIEMARLSLQSCRANLRNCLWDLRSRTFEEKTLSDAIVKTVTPHKATASISVACDIRTQSISANSIHAILCMIREAVINAVRHGKASAISITGHQMSGGKLSFTITDNGCGFDPLHAPGIGDGHFGLQGIRERAHALNGAFRLESSPGHGTTVKLTNLSPEH